MVGGKGVGVGVKCGDVVGGGVGCGGIGFGVV